MSVFLPRQYGLQFPYFVSKVTVYYLIWMPLTLIPGVLRPGFWGSQWNLQKWCTVSNREDLVLSQQNVFINWQATTLCGQGPSVTLDLSQGELLSIKTMSQVDIPQFTRIGIQKRNYRIQKPSQEIQTSYNSRLWQIRLLFSLRQVVLSPC